MTGALCYSDTRLGLAECFKIGVYLDLYLGRTRDPCHVLFPTHGLPHAHLRWGFLTVWSVEAHLKRPLSYHLSVKPEQTVVEAAA